jgi:hypothetical protein
MKSIPALYVTVGIEHHNHNKSHVPLCLLSAESKRVLVSTKIYFFGLFARNFIQSTIIEQL